MRPGCAPSGSSEPKALRFEVGIEGKCSLDLPFPHDRETDLIHQAHASLPGSFELIERLPMPRLVDPHDVEILRASGEAHGGRKAKPALEQGRRLDEDVVVCQKRFSIREQLTEEIDSPFVPGIRLIGEGVQSRCIDEDQRRFFGRKASARASSCRSETGDSLPWLERPAPTNGNCFNVRLRRFRAGPKASDSVSRTREEIDRPSSYAARRSAACVSSSIWICVRLMLPS